MLESPAVLRDFGFAFTVQLNDHEPKHVHVTRGKGSGAPLVKVRIDTDPVRSCGGHGFSRQEVRRIVRLVQERRTALLAGWRRVHGGG